ncbi:unnamed protein product [Coregonus sp. 'balchen']|nr:unnamed protein product [Coregonus sp. 'balchen']
MNSAVSRVLVKDVELFQAFVVFSDDSPHLQCNSYRYMRRVSVPEDHRLYLACSGTVDLQWRHHVNGIIVTKQGQSVAYRNHQKYHLQPDGSLVIEELEPSDSGDYYCNDQLVADVEVLKGQRFAVSAGRALLLPCTVSSKAKQRWFFRKDSHAKREPISTLFRNGTVKMERKDTHKRFSYDEDSALQILNLQPGDSGEYLCNGETAAKVMVLTVVMMIAVIGLCIVVLLAGLLGFLLIGRLSKRRKKCSTEHKQEGTELQTRCLSNLGKEHCPISPSHVEDTEVQYASLGRQNWRERSRVLGDQHHVIYSAVVTARPASQGCNVESATAGTLSLTPQDFVNVVALKEFYVQEGLLELEYPSLGTLSLNVALALQDAPSAASIPQTTVSVNVNEFLDSRYDYDFTNVKDGEAVFTRGKEQYVRPCGWNRIALKVLNKYRDGDGWLGTGDEAWPVSYHGPAMDGSQGIIRNDGDGDGAGATVGRGVYSTPDINIAEKFSKRFTSKVDNKTYKVVLQNRINPQKRQQCRRESYWLVYVPEGSSPVQERAIVENSIRPYGLLLKEVLGVYSTPDINIAEKFSKRFTSKVDNTTYKVVLQNRINPQKRQKCRRESYWLVYVPEGSSPVQERAIVENSIRPYGLLLKEFLDSRYDYDFTNVKDGEAVFTRGKEQYVRPCGWNRIALKVLNKYRDGDGWLGTGDDAWPVSYHGPAMDGSQGIIRNDGDGAGATVGRGVYSTPDINIAEKFSKRFTSKVDNKTYKVVLQNRINPQKRQQCQRESYWLVYVPEGSSPVQERAIVENSIRPYGLLLKEVLNDGDGDDAGATVGRGVYSTPDINIAEKFSKRFTSKVDNKTYKVVLQNRINPQKRQKCRRERYWLVYVPEGSSPVQERAIVENSIRPYGLLLKEVL